MNDYFKGRNFRVYLFSRGFIFAIGIFDNFAGTNFREFREFSNFQLFREDLFSRISRIFYFSYIKIMLVEANL